MTKIIHRGRYRVEGRRVIVSLGADIEVGERLEFTLSEEDDATIEQRAGHRRERWEDERAALHEAVCSVDINLSSP